MLTIKAVLDEQEIFTSQVWADVVDYVRNALDLQEDNEYITNIIDEAMRSDFGDWEMLPEYGETTPDAAAIQRQVDAIIGANALY